MGCQQKKREEEVQSRVTHYEENLDIRLWLATITPPKLQPPQQWRRNHWDISIDPADNFFEDMKSKKKRSEAWEDTAAWVDEGAALSVQSSLEHRPTTSCSGGRKAKPIDLDLEPEEPAGKKMKTQKSQKTILEFPKPSPRHVVNIQHLQLTVKMQPAQTGGAAAGAFNL